MKFLHKALALALIGVLIIVACKKTDTPKPEETSTVTPVVTEKFFNSHQPVNPLVLGAQHFLKGQNEKYHFTDAFIGRIGMPYWDKALIYSTGNAMARTESAEVPAAVVYIPFVRDSQNYVNAAVLVRMTATDTAYKVVCDWQYSQYGFDHSDTSWSARDVFAIFSNLDMSVFGYSKYTIKDGRIFGYPRETELIATVKDQNQPVTQTYVECIGHTVCIIATTPSSNKANNNNMMGTNQECTTSYTCSIVWTGGDSPGPPPPGNGGGGNGGGSAPGNGGPVVPPNPCNPQPRAGYYSTQSATINPCDSTVWVPEDDEIFKYADFEWDVYYVPSSAGGGAVLSLERFYGKVKAHDSNNYKFTGGTHLNNRLVANYDGGSFVCGTWGVTVNSPTQATAVCGGRISFPTGDRIISVNNSKTVQYTQLLWQ